MANSEEGEPRAGPASDEFGVPDAQLAFLLRLSDALRAAPDADALAHRALNMLAEQLALDRCYIGVYRLAEDWADVPYQVGNADVAPVPSGVRLSDFPDALRVAVDRTLVLDDVAAAPSLTDTDRHNIGALGFRALVAATLRAGEGRPLWCIVAVSARPRAWTSSEVVLLEEATERTWAALERARAEAELRAREEQYRALFDSIDEGFCTMEVLYDAAGRPADMRYLELNRAYQRQSGLADAAAGRTAREVLPRVEDAWVAAYGRVVETGESLRFEEHSRDVDRWFSVYLSRVGGEGSRVVAAVFDDITAQKRTEAALQASLEAAEAARRAAEAANRTKSEFLATMSHELRTPLNAIGGYAELIELGIHGPVTPDQGNALARIQRSQRHLLGLISGVLDYARVEAGAVTYCIVDVPVTEAVAEAETLVAPQLRAKGLEYAWSNAPPGLCVRADREKLQQILLNLLGNAVKFTEARDGAAGRIEVTCTVEHEQGRVRLHLRDTGAGISADDIRRVFEPFVQADQRLTRPHAGVGLGLAISRDLARGMGGDLTVESAPGVGSTFTLTLTLASAG